MLTDLPAASMVACPLDNSTDHDETDLGESSIDQPSRSDLPPAVLALDSALCFSFFRSLTQRKRLSNRKLMAYDLEDFLPIDADDLALDSIDTKVGSLIVAVDSGEVNDALQLLGDQDRYIAAICPTLFLAIATLSRQQSLRSVGYLVWQSSEGLDVVRLHDSKPIDWRWCGSNPDAARESLQSMEWVDETSRILWIDVPDAIRGQFADLDQATGIELDRGQAAQLECDRIVSGTAKPLIDLRNGPLESPNVHHAISLALKVFVAAALLFQVCLIAGVLSYRWRYQSRTADLVAAQEKTFQSTFPGESIPVGMVSRFQSEQRQLAGTRGVSGQATPRVASSMPTLHAFLSALPDSKASTFAIDRMEVLAGSIANMSGTAKSYSDLETFAESLRAAGFTVPPVSATKTSGGVSLRFDELVHQPTSQGK